MGPVLGDEMTSGWDLDKDPASKHRHTQYKDRTPIPSQRAVLG